MKKRNFTAMKTNTLLFIALFTLLSGNVKAQIQYLDNSGNFKFDYSKKQSEERFNNLIQNTPLIIRGDFVSGTSPNNLDKLLPEEKPYIENLMYIVPKKVKVKAVLRGDTSLIGKIITVPFKIGLTFEGELIHSSHTQHNYALNDEYDEYYFLTLNNNISKNYNLIDEYSIGEYFKDINRYGFGGVSSDEKSFFQAIIDSKKYNPKFMLEAGMKIPEKEKKAVGFLVKEAEEPSNKP